MKKYDKRKTNISSELHTIYRSSNMIYRVKVKESRNRSGVAQRVPGGLGFRFP
jgi:hypothetical protein